MKKITAFELGACGEKTGETDAPDAQKTKPEEKAPYDGAGIGQTDAPELLIGGDFKAMTPEEMQKYLDSER